MLVLDARKDSDIANPIFPDARKRPRECSAEGPRVIRFEEATIDESTNPALIRRS